MGSQAQADPRSSVPNYGAHEGNEGRCQGHEPGCSRSSTLREHGAEEGCVCEGSEELGRDWHAAGEECGKVRAPRLVHDQDTPEAGDEGWQEGGPWKGGHGQSQASKDSGEGIPRLSIEEGFLSSCVRSPVCCPWRKHTGLFIWFNVRTLCALCPCTS